MENPQFDTLVQSLTPALEALEKKRLELKKKGESIGIKRAAVCVAIGITVSFFVNAVLIGTGITVVVGLFVYFFCVNAKSAQLSSYYKQTVVSQVLQAFCENAVFTPEKGISEAEFRNSGLFTNPDRYHTEDLMQGRIDKTDFWCAEVHAEEKRTTCDSKGRTKHHWVDIFKGFLFIADFHKNFNGHTIIRRDSLIKFDFNNSRVKLENPDFEKLFDVYGTDQVEARYLLTPSMMEQLVALDKTLNRDITLSLRNSTILVAIPESKNRFEASIWNPVNNTVQLKEDFDTIRQLLSIVDELNLNTRIWGKK